MGQLKNREDSDIDKTGSRLPNGLVYETLSLWAAAVCMNTYKAIYLDNPGCWVAMDKGPLNSTGQRGVPPPQDMIV